MVTGPGDASSAPVAPVDALAQPIEVPGTGLRFRPPRGAELLVMGPVVRQRAQQLVFLGNVVGGQPAELATLWQAASQPGDGLLHSRLFDHEGRPAVLARTRGSDGQSLRLWLAVRSQDRIATVTVGLPYDAPAVLVELAEASLLTTTWDAAAALDGAAAQGFSLPAPEGMTPRPASTRELGFDSGGARPDASFTARFLATRPPALSTCPELAEMPGWRLVNRIVMGVELGGLQGCQLRAMGRAAQDKRRAALLTLLFTPSGLVHILGEVHTDAGMKQRDVWLERFVTATAGFLPLRARPSPG